ncbi:hypothetical protein CIB48_g6969 [Xylaria polymorpha]|nr:hypothetical protein CIB48_g6969 [Xylaria polymorpha]
MLSNLRPIDSTLQEAEHDRKNQSFCDSTNSPFYKYYAACLACTEAHPSPDSSDTLNALFQHFSQSCRSIGIAPAEAITTTVVVTVDDHPITVPITTSLGFDTFAVSSTGSAALLSIFNISFTLVSGFSKTPSRPLVSPTNDPFEGLDSPSRGQPWIAGPAVGSVARILLVILPIFLWYHRRKPPRGLHDSYKKPQLRSDCIPQQELEGTQVNELGVYIVELEGIEKLSELADTNKRHSKSGSNNIVSAWHQGLLSRRLVLNEALTLISHEMSKGRKFQED